MIAERINETAQFQLRFINDIIDGREVLMTRTFSGVKKDATDDAVFNTAMTLGNLQLKPVKTVTKVDRAELIQA